MAVDWIQHARFSQMDRYGKTRCEDGWAWTPRPLPDFDLWYVVSGKGEMLLQGQRYSLRKGACFLLRPGDQLQAVQDAEDRLVVIYVHFTMSFPRPIDEQAELPGRHTQLEDTYLFESLLHRILQLLYHDISWKEQEIEYIMKQMLLLFCRCQADKASVAPRLSRKQWQMMSNLVAYIREEGGKRIPHEQLAARIGISPQHMGVLFKRHTGTSLKEYVTKVRMERAMHLLTETSMNVSQVAVALNYANIHLFSKQFKQQFGYPPSHFQFKSASTISSGKATGEYK